MVGTTPTGVVFSVDGVNYVSTQTFLWPQGSKHVIQFVFTLGPSGSPLPYQVSIAPGAEYFFSGWEANGASIGDGASTITVTADPSLTSVIAALTTEYAVTVEFPAGSAPSCSGAPGNPVPTGTGYRGGIAYFNGTCTATTTSTYMSAGQISLVEYSYPGWVFYGWEINGYNYGNISTWNLTGPTTFIPQFSIAKRYHFLTTPVGYNVLVDRTQSRTPLVPSANGATCNPTENLLPPLPPPGFPALCIGDFDFLPGSTHTVGAPTPQVDIKGNYWVFEGYTDGLGQNSTFVVDGNINTASTFTATFVPGVHVQFITSQNGLHLSVDGTVNYGGGYTFIWGQGETHTVSAPLTQVDANGRTWTFVSWSNGGPATQTLTMPTNSTVLTLTANFVESPQVTINSSPAGMQFMVDGSACTTPCVVNHAAGYVMPVVAPSVVSTGAGSRINFGSWSDGGTSATRTVTFGQATQSLTASYLTEYSLTAVANPAGSAIFTYSPPTPDGYFVSGTSVAVSAAGVNGFKFVKWSGDLSGASSTGYLTMTSPHSITANMQSVPAIAPAGIMTAAGATPDGTMAPGSEISIYGQNLAQTTLIGSTNPLPQTLGNVTVTVGNYILPLLFVSPTQINAQLPVELVDGNYSLVVQPTGQPAVPATLTVSRNAPEMFTQANAQQLPLVLALHQDGSVITFASPAIRGEQISMFGTGFGPYVTPATDGFAVPATPADSVADPVLLNIAGINKAPDFAGAAPGAVGLTLVKMTITADLPTATTVNLVVSVNTKASSTVVLPLQ